MCKLKVNEVIIIRSETWGLKANKKYTVSDIKKDSRGNVCYYFKNHHKNVVNLIKCYADDIDKEVNKNTYKELQQNTLLLLLNHGNIFKWE